jgi:anti-anti-sigma factor
MAMVGRALQGSTAIREIVVNLSGLETVTSSFVAGLLVMRQLMEKVGNTMILCELNPRVRTLLQRLNLHSIFVMRG